MWPWFYTYIHTPGLHTLSSLHARKAHLFPALSLNLRGTVDQALQECNMNVNGQAYWSVSWVNILLFILNIDIPWLYLSMVQWKLIPRGSIIQYKHNITWHNYQASTGHAKSAVICLCLRRVPCQYYVLLIQS